VVIIVGSASISGTAPDAPDGVLTRSMEADIYLPDQPELSSSDGSRRLSGWLGMTDVINIIGESSQFHNAFGYCARGIDPRNILLPKSWRERLVKLRAADMDYKRRRPAWIGYCLDPNDLAVAKLIAGREKDAPFVKAMIDLGIADPSIIAAGLRDLERPVDPGIAKAAEAGLTRIASGSFDWPVEDWPPRPSPFD
jgi:hypothetical protein